MTKEALVQEALAKSPVERTAFLESACAGKTELRQAVEALLAAHEAKERVVDPPVLEVPNVRRDEATLEPSSYSGSPETPAHADFTFGIRSGTVIASRYTLQELLGAGGMGEVWVAQQSEPVKRQVALKLIKTGMDSKAVLARFEQERQALAVMDHPNIAKVLDGGVTVAGQPYFVMELVNGQSLTRFCDEAKLTPRQRLELFVPICQAVQHAHQKGIVHRDLKPANILVTQVDGKPVPKVIDFGVAKATAAKLTDETMATQLGAVIGTLEYMAPEQAGGEDIDTRADIYSLGVILYELLTGLRPIDAAQFRKAAILDMIVMLMEHEPSKPSTRLSTADGLPSLAAVRQTDPKKLTAMLRGELDWVVMKCLEKQRDRRYESANGLARDIQRYLADEVVEARPPSARYRFQKFVSRNKGQVIAASLVLLALVGGAIGTSIGMVKANRALIAENERAEAEVRERRRAEAAEAETAARAKELQQVADFQAEMFAQVDPTAAGQDLTADVTAKFALALAKTKLTAAEQARLADDFRSLWGRLNATDTARDLIDRAILKPAIQTIAEKFRDQPLVAAQLRQTLAKQYRTLGLQSLALPLQRDALATRQQLLGDDHPDTLDSLSRTGWVLQELGKLAEAEPYYQQVLSTRRRLLGGDHPDTISATHNMGYLLRSRGKFAEAELHFREALEKNRRVRGEDHPHTLETTLALANILRFQGKVSESEPYFRAALDKNRRVRGEDHPETLLALVGMGNLMLSLNRLRESEGYFREALERRLRVLGEDNRNTLSAKYSLGSVLVEQDRLDEAEPILREALGKMRKVYGEDHTTTLLAVNSLGNLCKLRGRLAEAEPLFLEVLQKYRRALGPDHPFTFTAVIALAGLRVEQGRDAEVVEMLEPVLGRLREEFTGKNAYRVALALYHLGRAKATLAKTPAEFAAAEAALTESHAIYVRDDGDGHKNSVRGARALAQFYAAREKAEPGKGYNGKATEWKKKLEKLTPAEKNP